MAFLRGRGRLSLRVSMGRCAGAPAPGRECRYAERTMRLSLWGLLLSFVATCSSPAGTSVGAPTDGAVAIGSNSDGAAGANDAAMGAGGTGAQGDAPAGEDAEAGSSAPDGASGVDGAA